MICPNPLCSIDAGSSNFCPNCGRRLVVHVQIISSAEVNQSPPVVDNSQPDAPTNHQSPSMVNNSQPDVPDAGSPLSPPAHLMPSVVYALRRQPKVFGQLPLDFDWIPCRRQRGPAGLNFGARVSTRRARPRPQALFLSGGLREGAG